MNHKSNASFEQLMKAIEATLRVLSNHPNCDSELVEAIKRGDFDAAVKIGGDVADISECVARLQLGLEGKDQP